MRYYIVRENDRWVIINPIDLFTQDWQSYESEYFIYHVPREVHLADHMYKIRASDQSCENMLRFFHIELTDKIHFYAPRTAEECGELILHPSAHGYGVIPTQKWMRRSPANYKIISPSLYHPHEVAHCLTGLAGISLDNHIIAEGLAVALGGVAGADEELTLIEASNMLGASKLLPLERLFTMPKQEYFRTNYITYYESGALIRFLHDRFGIEKLRRFCTHIEDIENLGESLEDAFQMSLNTLEDEFHKYLLSRKSTAIGFDVPPEATPVFAMADPQNDDKGDGDYVYPQHPNFAKGVFDLRQFSVFKDSDNAYFKITMSKLMTPVSYGSSDEQFTPCIVIAINDGDSKERALNRDCHGVRFPHDEGYNIKLNVGSAVSVSNHLGKVYYTTPDIVYEYINKEENAIELSVPLAMIGEPEEDWKYFVGVGLTSNRTMNFIDGGPMPVRQDHRVFISGGNFSHGNPNFIDILLPPSLKQKKVLSHYDMPTNIKPIVPMIEGS
ncbi:MAG: hypothetical protein JSV84_16810 [Gemmatimonadota bacterium]|nr:MAG: hypothetical protein JSV84_16810 [Gemmatimonadota bacterium]